MAYQDSIQHRRDAQRLPRVRTITPRDLVDALAKGIDDFAAMPTHALFVSLIYPIAGLVIAIAVSGSNLLWLFYPMAAGFALIGPVAAVGLYELSRRREQGSTPTGAMPSTCCRRSRSARSPRSGWCCWCCSASGSAWRRRSTGPISATRCRSRSTASRGRC